jgi:hypothetical protein
MFAYNWKTRRKIKDFEVSESKVFEERLRIRFHEKRCSMSYWKRRFWPTTNEAAE